METILFLLNHMLTYCINVDLGKIVLKSVNIASISSIYSIQNPYLKGHILGKSTGTTQ